jgi:hypothetical protein
LHDKATSGINNENGREGGDKGSGSSSVNVLGVKWVSLVVCVGQAGVCTVIYPLLGLGPGGRVLMRLGLC